MMDKRETVAKAIYEAQLGLFDDWRNAKAVIQAEYLCMADYALDALYSYDQKNPPSPPQPPGPPNPPMPDLDEHDPLLAEGIEKTVGDWYERNGLR